MKHIFFILVPFLLCSCSTTRHVQMQVAEHIHKDTVYLSNTQYDSIYIVKDRFQDRSKDTVYLKDVSIEYRYKMIHDTVKVVQRDSIPYEVTVVQAKEIVRPLTIFDRLCRICFYFLSGVLFVLLVRFVFNLKSKLRI